MWRMKRNGQKPKRQEKALKKQMPGQYDKDKHLAIQV